MGRAHGPSGSGKPRSINISAAYTLTSAMWSLRGGSIFRNSAKNQLVRTAREKVGFSSSSNFIGAYLTALENVMLAQISIASPTKSKPKKR